MSLKEVVLQVILPIVVSVISSLIVYFVLLLINKNKNKQKDLTTKKHNYSIEKTEKNTKENNEILREFLPEILDILKNDNLTKKHKEELFKEISKSLDKKIGNLEEVVPLIKFNDQKND